ncbi:nuclear transport factor 2 family protein [Nocardia miyunensis]|uniref:nuclear transport factor 2 family protein n=1 Tax=Nocardia miyunensis TaxID=282684 RepID=UPI00082DFE09|nr:nuclear transport factor 2 family protein [Nocardia miyunensis]
MEAGELAKSAVAVLESLVDVARADDFLGYLDDDVTWVIPGSWPGISGVKDKARIERFVRRTFPAGFPTGLEVDIRAVHVHDPTVVIEFVGRASTSKDREYVNRYCFVFVFRSSRVIEIREYMDTLYADGVLHK